MVGGQVEGDPDDLVNALGVLEVEGQDGPEL